MKSNQCQSNYLKQIDLLSLRFYALQHPIRNTFGRIEYNVLGIKMYLEIFTMQLEIH